MKIDKETTEKIQEIQLIEQNIQSFSLQKQAFQIELSESTNALTEVEKTKDDVYKIAGQIMLKSTKEEIKKELEEKKHILELRIKSVEQQEILLVKKLEELKKQIENKIKKSK